MDSAFIPNIRLSIEGMKASIIQHMGLYGSDLGAVVQAEIDLAVESELTSDAIQAAVQQAITAEINRYFKYGEGAEAISSSVNGALNGLMKKEPGHEED